MPWYLFAAHCALVVIQFVFEAGMALVLCMALQAAGVTSICGWTVSFSWELILFACLFIGAVRGLINVKNNKNGA